MTTVTSTHHKGVKEHVQVVFTLASIMDTSEASVGFIVVVGAF